MNLSGIQVAIFLFLTIDVIFHAIVIRFLMGIDVLMSAVKDEYLNIIKKEIAQTNTCLKEWESCIEKLQESEDFANEIFDLLEEVTKDDQTGSNQNP